MGYCKGFADSWWWDVGRGAQTHYTALSQAPPHSPYVIIQVPTVVLVKRTFCHDRHVLYLCYPIRWSFIHPQLLSTRNVATMADEPNFNFSLTQVNFHLQLYRHTWLTATMLGSTALGVAQSAGNYYFTQVLPVMAGISSGAKRVVLGEWRKMLLSL